MRKVVRRKDREVKDTKFFIDMLQNSATCSIGLVDQNGGPYVNSNLFIYDEATTELYFHTAFHGYTREIIEKNNNTCISFSRIGRFYTAKRAFNFGVEYFSATIFGEVSIVADEDLKRKFFDRFLTKYFPDSKSSEYEAPSAQELKLTTVFKVRISDWTAKKHEIDQGTDGKMPAPVSRKRRTSDPK